MGDFQPMVPDNSLDTFIKVSDRIDLYSSDSVPAQLEDLSDKPLDFGECLKAFSVGFGVGLWNSAGAHEDKSEKAAIRTLAVVVGAFQAVVTSPLVLAGGLLGGMVKGGVKTHEFFQNGGAGKIAKAAKKAFASIRESRTLSETSSRGRTNLIQSLENGTKYHHADRTKTLNLEKIRNMYDLIDGEPVIKDQWRGVISERDVETLESIISEHNVVFDLNDDVLGEFKETDINISEMSDDKLARLVVIQEKVAERRELNEVLNNETLESSPGLSWLERKEVKGMREKIEGGTPLDASERTKLRALMNKHNAQLARHEESARSLRNLFEALGGDLADIAMESVEIKKIDGSENDWEFPNYLYFTDLESSEFRLLEGKDQKTIEDISDKLTDGKQITDDDFAKLADISTRYATGSTTRAEREAYLKKLDEVAYSDDGEKYLTDSEYKLADSIANREIHESAKSSDKGDVAKLHAAMTRRKARNETCQTNLKLLTADLGIPSSGDDAGKYNGKEVYTKDEIKFLKEIDRKLKLDTGDGRITKQEAERLQKMKDDYDPAAGGSDIINKRKQSIDDLHYLANLPNNRGRDFRVRHPLSGTDISGITESKTWVDTDAQDTATMKAKAKTQHISTDVAEMRFRAAVLCNDLTEIPYADVGSKQIYDANSANNKSMLALLYHNKVIDQKEMDVIQKFHDGKPLDRDERERMKAVDKRVLFPLQEMLYGDGSNNTEEVGSFRSAMTRFPIDPLKGKARL